MCHVEVYGRVWKFWTFPRVVKCYNWASNDAVVSLLYADILELCEVIKFYTNVMNLHESSLTVARIVVNFTLK